MGRGILSQVCELNYEFSKSVFTIELSQIFQMSKWGQKIYPKKPTLIVKVKYWQRILKLSGLYLDHAFPTKQKASRIPAEQDRILIIQFTISPSHPHTSTQMLRFLLVRGCSVDERDGPRGMPVISRLAERPQLQSVT